tara:strand:- start:4 stop:168 length:165 start_codon:yes stop_codon:yes gene_type:complete
MDSFFLFDRSTGMVMAVPTAVACFHSSPGFQVSLVLPGQWHMHVFTHASYVSAQ